MIYIPRKNPYDTSLCVPNCYCLIDFEWVPGIGKQTSMFHEKPNCLLVESPVKLVLYIHTHTHYLTNFTGDLYLFKWLNGYIYIHT